MNVAFTTAMGVGEVIPPRGLAERPRRGRVAVRCAQVRRRVRAQAAIVGVKSGSTLSSPCPQALPDARSLAQHPDLEHPDLQHPDPPPTAAPRVLESLTQAGGDNRLVAAATPLLELIPGLRNSRNPTRPA